MSLFNFIVSGCRIIEENTKEAAVVDPVEPHKILRVAEENGVDLKLVLTTHHHWLCSFLLFFEAIVCLGSCFSALGSYFVGNMFVILSDWALEGETCIKNLVSFSI